MSSKRKRGPWARVLTMMARLNRENAGLTRDLRRQAREMDRLADLLAQERADNAVLRERHRELNELLGRV